MYYNRVKLSEREKQLCLHKLDGAPHLLFYLDEEVIEMTAYQLQFPSGQKVGGVPES